MSSMRVMVSPGKHVRDPRTKQPLAEGVAVTVPNDPYWSRRMADGDVVPAPPREAEVKAAQTVQAQSYAATFVTAPPSESK